MLFLILGFAFFIRLLPRLILPFAIADDGYGHFANASNIKNSGLRIPEYYSKTLFKQVFGYPFFFPFLLALFPIRAQLIIERVISPLFDVLIIFLSFKLLNIIAGSSGLFLDDLTQYSFAFLMAVLPVFLRNDSGPRAYQGSARLIGQFFFLSLVYFYLRYIQSHSIYFFLSAVGCGALIFLSSTFATQVFIFTGIFISLFFSPYYFLVVFGAIFLFYIVTLGKAHQIVAGGIKHHEWYFKFYQVIGLQKWSHFNNPIVDYFNKLKQWLGLIGKFKLRSFAIYFNIDNNPIHLLLTTYFFYIGIFFTDWSIAEERYLAILCISSLLVYFLTMTKPLLFLGECYRYLEFTIPAGLILFFVAFQQQQWFLYLIWIWICISLVRYIFFQLDFYRVYKSENANHKIYKSFFSEINSIVDGNVYASSHFRTKAAYFGNFSYLGNRGLMDLKHISLEDNYLAFGNYPMPSGNYWALIKRFDLKFWLTTKSDLDSYLAHTSEYGDFLSSLVLLAKDDRISTFLFKVKT